MKRRGHLRVVGVEEHRRKAVPPVAILPGPAPMTARLAEIIRAMVDRQRVRERGSGS